MQFEALDALAGQLSTQKEAIQQHSGQMTSIAAVVERTESMLAQLAAPEAEPTARQLQNTVP